MTPTPEAMLQQLVALCPSFEAYWQNEENIIHREDDGSFTLHGLFTEFSHFIRLHFGCMPEPARQELFGFLETCLTVSEAPPYDDLDNAVCTGFFENLAGEPFLSSELRRYLGPKSGACFDFWD